MKSKEHEIELRGTEGKVTSYFINTQITFLPPPLRSSKLGSCSNYKMHLANKIAPNSK